jgi:hypothetical protein
MLGSISAVEARQYKLKIGAFVRHVLAKCFRAFIVESLEKGSLASTAKMAVGSYVSRQDFGAFSVAKMLSMNAICGVGVNN